MRHGERRPAPAIFHDPEIPTPGCYRVRLRRGAHDSGVRIWHGPSLDPATDEESHDRPSFWQCELNGARVPIEEYWPGCAREPISREEYDRLCRRNATMDQASPFYDPKRPIDLGRAPPPF